MNTDTAQPGFLTFQRQESAQTLAQGLAEYHAAYPGLARGSNLSAEAQAFFRSHDVVHVVFGCDISLDDELVVKLCSLFGTTGGLGVLKGYRTHESLDIYRQLKVRDVLVSIVHSVWLLPLTLARVLRQRARWTWDGFDTQLDRPLADIRTAFGIRVAHPHRGGL